MKCFPDYTFSYETQKFKSPWSLEKKMNFYLCNFQQNLLCCMHDQSCWQIDLPACLPAQVRSHRSH